MDARNSSIICKFAQNQLIMQIWINKNGQQSGPFSIEEVRAMQIDVDSTYVWYEGLDNWILASKSALDFTAQPEPEPQE